MNYHIIYTEDVRQIVAAVIISARSVTMPLGVNGIEVQAYIDSVMAKVTSNTIVYKLENNDGNLVGYFTVEINVSQKTGAKGQQLLRAPFIPNLVEINDAVSVFMQHNLWKNDFLF